MNRIDYDENRPNGAAVAAGVVVAGFGLGIIALALIGAGCGAAHLLGWL